jgi:hypothetical protein
MLYYVSLSLTIIDIRLEIDTALFTLVTIVIRV